MAPQVVEKAESAPGNGAALEASQVAAAIRDEVSASFLETPAQEFALAAPPTDRLETAPQELEKAESAAGNGSAWEVSDPLDAAPVSNEAFAHGDAPAQESAGAPPANRPETAPQAVEKAEFAPGNGVAWARPLGGASCVCPAASPGALRRANVRATLNGIAAC